jgi:hypothetical protein
MSPAKDDVFMGLERKVLEGADESVVRGEVSQEGLEEIRVARKVFILET